MSCRYRSSSISAAGVFVSAASGSSPKWVTCVVHFKEGCPPPADANADVLLAPDGSLVGDTGLYPKSKSSMEPFQTSCRSVPNRGAVRRASGAEPHPRTRSGPTFIRTSNGSASRYSESELIKMSCGTRLPSDGENNELKFVVPGGGNKS